MNDFLASQVFDGIDQLAKDSMTGDFWYDWLMLDEVKKIRSFVIVHNHQKPIVVNVYIVDCLGNIAVRHV